MTAENTADPSAPDTVVLIHGLWVTPRSWEHWIEHYEGRGYRVLAPAYPGLEVEVEALNEDPSPIEALTIPGVVEHLEGIVGELENPPIIMGHSAGGLFTQILLDHGYGAAGVVIDSAPAEGVRVTPIAQIRALFPVLKNPANRHRAVGFTKEQFHNAFANTLSREDSDEVYERYHIPAPGSFVWAGPLANFTPGHQDTYVNFRNEERAPLLFIAGSEDNIMPPAVNQSNVKHYRHAKTVTDYKEFAGRSHYTVGQDGWEEVADYALEWANEHATTRPARKEILMSSSPTHLSTPEGPGSVSGAPNLPAGFTDTFTSRFIEANGLRQHAVIGGEGPPLLMVHGWPENWYAWRLLMPQLARDFQVIAVDQRGIGLTDKPQDGYDTGTLAGDLVALMDELGHERFAVVGHDTGYFIGYALAADHPDRVDRMALAEVPGPLGVNPSPPLFGLPEPINNKLWHLAFNRVNDEMTEQLVRGREDIFFGYEFAIQGGQKGLPDEVQRYYFDLYSDPDVLRGSFGLYRALDTTLAQNAERKNRPLTMPVLAIGGAESWGEEAANGMKPAADDVQTVVIPDTGHWVAEQAPDQMLEALTEFLAPYREDGGGLR
ncbi:MAG TPA: alpha/beta hydrolase [Rubrobacter sp.]|nr:alpha/beta hydrolase [Rubrobacter sp.]